MLNVRAYFSRGLGWSYETNPQEIIDYVAEEKLYIKNEGEVVGKVLIRVKEINVINRTLLSSNPDKPFPTSAVQERFIPNC